MPPFEESDQIPTTPTRQRTDAAVTEPAMPLPPMPDEQTILRRQRCQQIIDMAASLEREGDVQGAVDALRMGIASLRAEPALYNRLAILLAYRRHAFADAEALLRQALRLAPSDRDSERNLERVLAMSAARVGHERRMRRSA